ncbi:hypothetical protein AMJ80_03310 [bacterium SM23_31]|nr:MAG: hypothetical protein AMJ80_03310 [bacterium SM23_31]
MIEHRKEKGYTIATVSGKLMGGPETAEFYNFINSLQLNGTVNLILDLGNVRWINGAGIRALINSDASLKQYNRAIKFVNLSPKVKDILTITGVSSVLDIYDSVEDAKK